MKKIKLSLFLLAFVFTCLSAVSVSAHQPRMIETKEPIKVENPELSQAFYEVLSGEPQIYTIESDNPFLLYTNVLVPKSSNPDQRYGVKIYQIDGDKKKLLKNMAPFETKWELFHEEFAGDDYYQGPEFEKDVSAGKYEIEVYGGDNLGRYVLAIGKKEEFGIGSLASVLTILPKLKVDFFEVSPLTLLTAKLGIVLITEIIILILLSFMVWKLIRWMLKKYFVKYKFEKNLNFLHRILRLVLASTILLLAIDFWSIILGVISSFFFYEAASSWCGLFSFLKINTISKKQLKK